MRMKICVVVVVALGLALSFAGSAPALTLTGIGQPYSGPVNFEIAYWNAAQSYNFTDGAEHGWWTGQTGSVATGVATLASATTASLPGAQASGDQQPPGKLVEYCYAQLHS